MDHDCTYQPDDVEISNESFNGWHLSLFEEDCKEFDDDGMVGFEKEYDYIGEVKIKFCPFCGEELE